MTPGIPYIKTCNGQDQPYEADPVFGQSGESLEDADQVMAILVELKVMGPILPDLNIRELASEWLQIIEKPKRRRNQEISEDLMYHVFLDGEKKYPCLKD